MSDFLERVAGNKRTAFIFVFLAVTGVLVLGSYWVITIAVSIVQEPDPTSAAIEELSPIYVSYQVDVDEYVSGLSYLRMGQYQTEHEQPRNVRVLEGYSTQEINGYMMNHIVAGLGVNCTYCHNINNFAAGPEWDGEDVPFPEDEENQPHPEWEANKTNARRHLELVQDLNRNWLADDVLTELTSEKQPSGAQMACATCHYAQAQPVSYPADQEILPDDFRLPLDAEFDLTAENEGILNVNARQDISLDTVNYQQNVMYHMNTSMNVGCTHCHNSRYFPSREVPAIHYAQHMLEMSQYIWLNYSDSMGGQMPSCNLCHNGAIIPPGAAVSVDVLPPQLVPEVEGTDVAEAGS